MMTYLSHLFAKVKTISTFLQPLSSNPHLWLSFFADHVYIHHFSFFINSISFPFFSLCKVKHTHTHTNKFNKEKQERWQKEAQMDTMKDSLFL